MTPTTDIVARLRELANTFTARAYNTDPWAHLVEDQNAVLLREAAKWIDARDARISALEAEVARLREALEPFAQAAEIKLCGGDFWTNDKFIQNTDVAFHVRFGDLRRARAALEGQK